MKRKFLVGALFLVSSFSNCAQTKTDLISKIWDGVGGKKTWENSRYFVFTFEPQREGKVATSRNHLWDRYTGDYRYEAKTPDKQQLVVLFNINNQKGDSYIDGKPATDSLNQVYLKEAHQAFINDSYWLVAPAKLEDEGVTTREESPEVINGKSCGVLHINFKNVGLTPGDQYWLYVDPDNGQIVRWKFLLEGQKEESAFNWSGYKDIGGGLKLSVQKQNIDNNTVINFPVASVLISVEPDKFKKP